MSDYYYTGTRKIWLPLAHIVYTGNMKISFRNQKVSRRLWFKLSAISNSVPENEIYLERMRPETCHTGNQNISSRGPRNRKHAMPYRKQKYFFSGMKSWACASSMQQETELELFLFPSSRPTMLGTHLQSGNL